MNQPNRRMSALDVAGIGLLGAVGFGLSYDALQQTAQAIHVRGDLTYAFPLIIDGFIAYGVRALVLLREAKWSARLYAWTLFAGATTVSIWANALHAVTLNDEQTQHLAFHLQDRAVGALSTLAPLGLAGSVHLYILVARNAHQDQTSGPANTTTTNTIPLDDAPVLQQPQPPKPLRGLITRLARTVSWDRGLDQSRTGPEHLAPELDSGPHAQVIPFPAPSASSGGPQSPGPSASSGGPQSPGPSASSGGPQSPGPSASSGGPQSPGPSASSGGPQSPGPSASSAGPQSPGPSASSAGPQSPGPSASSAGPQSPGPSALSAGPQPPGPSASSGGEDLELLPVVRAAADRVGSATRKAVSAELRSSGHPISNRRLGLLLQALKDEQGPPASGSPPPPAVRPYQPPTNARTRKP